MISVAIGSPSWPQAATACKLIQIALMAMATVRLAYFGMEEVEVCSCGLNME